MAYLSILNHKCFSELSALIIYNAKAKMMPVVKKGLLSAVQLCATLVAARNRCIFLGEVFRHESFYQSLKADVICSPDNAALPSTDFDLFTQFIPSNWKSREKKK